MIITITYTIFKKYNGEAKEPVKNKVGLQRNFFEFYQHAELRVVEGINSDVRKSQNFILRFGFVLP